MFGIGTPPLLARPICFRTGRVTRLPAVVLAGKRLLAAASVACGPRSCHVVGDEVLRRGADAVASRRTS